MTGERVFDMLSVVLLRDRGHGPRTCKRPRRPSFGGARARRRNAMAAPLADVLDRAAAVLAELREVDLDGLVDDSLSDAVLALQRLRGGLDVAEARVLARWEAQGCWRASGAKTGAAWLAWKQRVPIEVARQRVRHARVAAHPARHRGGVGGRATSTGPTSPPCWACAPPAPPRRSTAKVTHGSSTSPATTGSSTSSGPATAGSWSSTPTAPNRAPTTTEPPERCTCRRPSAVMWFGQAHPRPDLRHHRRHHPAADRT